MAGGKSCFFSISSLSSSFVRFGWKSTSCLTIRYLHRGKCLYALFICYHSRNDDTDRHCQSTETTMNKTVPMCGAAKVRKLISHHPQEFSKAIDPHTGRQRWDACVLPVACACRAARCICINKSSHEGGRTFHSHFGARCAVAHTMEDGNLNAWKPEKRNNWSD